MDEVWIAEGRDSANSSLHSGLGHTCCSSTPRYVLGLA